MIDKTETNEIEAVTFLSGAQSLAWHKNVVSNKATKAHYDRIPKCAAVSFRDGHYVKLNIGKRGGTFWSNASFFVGTSQGKMKHAADNAALAEIDKRGGVTLWIEW